MIGSRKCTNARQQLDITNTFFQPLPFFCHNLQACLLPSWTCTYPYQLPPHIGVSEVAADSLVPSIHAPLPSNTRIHVPSTATTAQQPLVRIRLLRSWDLYPVSRVQPQMAAHLLSLTEWFQVKHVFPNTSLSHGACTIHHSHLY